MPFALTSVINSLLEIDEVKYDVVGDKTLVTFVTTGFNPTLTEIKTWIWGILGQPPEALRVTKIDEVRRGPLRILKRYQVECVMPKVGFRLPEAERYGRLGRIKSLRRK